MFFIGANEYDMVGLDVTVPLADYIAEIGDLLQEDLKWYKRFGILFSLILLTYWDELKNFGKRYWLRQYLFSRNLIFMGEQG